jgi:hypothetical protein
VTDRTQLEWRWFGTGAAPPDVAALLRGLPEEHRTDRYAVLGRDDLGVKRCASGLLVVKERQERRPTRSGLPPVERWARCRIPRRHRTRHGVRPARSDRLAQLGLELDGSTGDWVTLGKVRQRLVLDLSGSVPRSVQVAPRRVAHGGALELTVVRLPDGRDLWSVEVETWGVDDGLDSLSDQLASDQLASDQLALSDQLAVDWAGVDDRAVFAGSYPALVRRLAGQADSRFVGDSARSLSTAASRSARSRAVRSTVSTT